MSPGRYDLMREVRAVLCRHMIDIARISMRISTSDRLTMNGWLKRLPGCPSALKPEIVGAIMGELKHIKGIKGVSAAFVNWRQAEGGGKWEIFDVPDEVMSGGKFSGPSQMFVIEAEDLSTPTNPASS